MAAAALYMLFKKRAFPQEILLRDRTNPLDNLDDTVIVEHLFICFV